MLAVLLFSSKTISEAPLFQLPHDLIDPIGQRRFRIPGIGAVPGNEFLDESAKGVWGQPLKRNNGSVFTPGVSAHSLIHRVHIRLNETFLLQEGHHPGRLGGSHGPTQSDGHGQAFENLISAGAERQGLIDLKKACIPRIRG